MMRFATCLALLVGCASSMNSNPNPWQTPEEVWADAPQERAAIQCAARRLYPAQAARFARVPVNVRDAYQWNGLNYGGAINLRGADRFRSAAKSAWRHEAVHWLEHERSGEWTQHPACEQEPFLTRERLFREAYSACISSVD